MSTRISVDKEYAIRIEGDVDGSVMRLKPCEEIEDKPSHVTVLCSNGTLLVFDHVPGSLPPNRLRILSSGTGFYDIEQGASSEMSEVFCLSGDIVWCLVILSDESSFPDWVQSIRANPVEVLTRVCHDLWSKTAFFFGENLDA